MEIVRMKVLSDKIKEGTVNVQGTLLDIENAIIAFFDEKGSTRLGTLSIAVPQHDGKTCISSVLLGDRNVLITKILAEQLAKHFTKIALVSTHFAEITENQKRAVLINLAQRISEKAKLDDTI
jgi:hypothetical protein